MVQGEPEPSGWSKAWGKIKAAYNKVGTLNFVLLLVFLFFLWFNWQMLVLFRLQGAIPETYACAVVAATIGECGICGWIRTTKDKKHKRDCEPPNDDSDGGNAAG